MEEINWEELRTGYNRIFETSYKTIKDVIIDECKSMGIENFADRLGIHKSSVNRIKTKLKITKKYSLFPGGYKKKIVLDFLRKNKDAKKMTPLELSEATKVSRQYVYTILRRNNLTEEEENE